LSAFCFGEPLAFKRAVELAIQHSTTTAIAAADEARAKQGYYEARNMYLPQMTLGSGVAYSNGFPLSIEGSAPSIISINSQQYLFNAAGKNYLRATKTEWSASSRLAAEKRADVILDAATVYSELDKLDSSLRVLHQQEQAAIKVEQVARERFQAGVD